MRENQAQTTRYWRQKLAIICAFALLLTGAKLRLTKATHDSMWSDKNSLTKPGALLPTPARLAPSITSLQNKMAFGVYDPKGSFKQEQVLIEHKFTPWRLNNATEFTAAIKAARQTRRFPMVTLEPWPWEWNGMTSDIKSG